MCVCECMCIAVCVGQQYESLVCHHCANMYVCVCVCVRVHMHVCVCVCVCGFSCLPLFQESCFVTYYIVMYTSLSNCKGGIRIMQFYVVISFSSHSCQRGIQDHEDLSGCLTKKHLMCVYPTVSL